MSKTTQSIGFCKRRIAIDQNKYETAFKDIRKDYQLYNLNMQTAKPLPVEDKEFKDNRTRYIKTRNK